MSKVICGDLACKYNDNNYKCTKKEIILNYCSVHTLYQGPQTYLKCKGFEERDDAWYKNAKDLISKIINEEKKLNEHK